MTGPILTPEDRAFVEAHRVARLATADSDGVPHVVPICFVLVDDTIYMTIDEKPKRARQRPLKRVRNIIENPHATVIVDRYDDDWSQLGWVMLRGTAEVLDHGPEHDDAQARLRLRYPQYHSMKLEDLAVIAVRIVYAGRWGNLTIDA